MNVAFIPVRGGSKSIPLKNIKRMCGKPLIYWTARAACACKYIDKVYIATDSDVIRDTVLQFYKEDKMFSKMEVIGRSKESATDTASTEFAMLEFADKYEFNNIVLIQATSPLLIEDDLNRGFELFNEEGTDSVMSAVMQKRFNWSVDNQGIASPINYDVYNRPRRQDFDGYYVENGAFYITSKARLLESKNRISGNIRILPMREESFWEIDEPSDWDMIEKLMLKQSIHTKKRDIKILLTDCDGCLTDGGMYYSENGDELKKFNTKDGMAFKILREKGIRIGIITGESVDLNRRRAEKLHMDYYIPGCSDKLEAVKMICEKERISLSDVCYVGDDINDLETIKAVGLGCCPSDANIEIRSVADYISTVRGGQGVIRDIVDNICNKNS